MSGGSLDYTYTKVNDVAESIEARAETPLHRAFAAHLRLVSQALHDLEWVWSYDYSPGDEVEAIQAVVSPTAVLEQATKHAEQALAQLRAALDAALGGE